MPRYAHVILPLPLAESYTYTLPASFVSKVHVGCRLIVPFGSRKVYTGLVIGLSDEKPAGDFVLKEAMELLDEYPVVLPSQLRLWQWIADYYLCTMGDVMKAAMPSGMKLESESVVVADIDGDFDQPLSPLETSLLQALEQKKQQSVDELQKAVGSGHVLPAIHKLMEKGLVQIKEEVKRTYKPRMVACVRLTKEYFDEAGLQEARGTLSRAPKQLAMLDAYLKLSKASLAIRLNNPELLLEVERSGLIEQGGNLTVLKALEEKGYLERYDKVVARRTSDNMPRQLLLGELSPSQQKAFSEIKNTFLSKDVVLLQGVTGSGKTEVYIHLMCEAVERGEQVLYLLPEIVLTTQLVERLKRVFGDRLGVYHSKYPDPERVEVWQKQLSDSPYDIIVGVRSSVFLPFQNLKLVIVDEEHETSYKQQEPAPRYHARSVALMMARQCGAKVLLGTATPCVESYYLSCIGRYGRVNLTERYSRVQLPEIVVADVMDLRRRKLMTGVFSPQLLQAMRHALERKEQVILFLNRRGYAPSVECHECGWTPRCQNCDVSLTYHRDQQRMTCHYCGAVYGIPHQCPNCGCEDLSNRGYGTERIQEEIQKIFPAARTQRMDLDTTRNRLSYERIISDFQQGGTDILVGTQMVTKGLDFERVSVVGILNADTMMNIPDFRSYERAFQMMVQVAGRAGRRQARGLVVLQTRDAEHEVVKQVCASDFDAMFRGQLEERQMFRYPPFTRLTYVYLKHKDARVADALAMETATCMRRVFGERVLGPDTPAVGRVQQFYIRKLILKVEKDIAPAEVRSRLRSLHAYLMSNPAYKSAQIYFDVDPV